MRASIGTGTVELRPDSSGPTTMRGSLATTLSRSLAMGAVSLLLIACTAVPAPAATSPGTTGAPAAVIAAPAANISLPLGAPTLVRAVASDPVGVARLELSVDGVSVASHRAPGGPPTALSADLAWTPSSEGAHLLSVTAYRTDGTPSAPAVVAVSVVAGGASTSPGASALPVPSALPPVLPPGVPSRAPATGRPPVVSQSPAVPTVTQTPGIPPVVTHSPGMPATGGPLNLKFASFLSDMVTGPAGAHVRVTVGIINEGRGQRDASR